MVVNSLSPVYLANGLIAAQTGAAQAQNDTAKEVFYRGQEQAQIPVTPPVTSAQPKPQHQQPSLGNSNTHPEQDAQQVRSSEMMMRQPPATSAAQTNAAAFAGSTQQAVQVKNSIPAPKSDSPATARKNEESGRSEKSLSTPPSPYARRLPRDYDSTGHLVDSAA
jgi:hypothetical protein